MPQSHHPRAPDLTVQQLTEQLTRQGAPGVWRGRDRHARSSSSHLSTGWPELDSELPGGGWPLGTMTEILCDKQGIGELRMLMPALARLSQSDRWLVWLGPPFVPYAPMLARSGITLSRVLWLDGLSAEKRLWAAEQTLRHPACGASLVWAFDAAPGRSDRALRRIQLAAESGGSWALMFRSSAAAVHASPAPLRLKLDAARSGVRLQILKCRGRPPSRPIDLSLPLRHGAVPGSPP